MRNYPTNINLNRRKRNKEYPNKEYDCCTDFMLQKMLMILNDYLYDNSY